MRHTYAGTAQYHVHIALGPVPTAELLVQGRSALFVLGESCLNRAATRTDCRACMRPNAVKESPDRTHYRWDD